MMVPRGDILTVEDAITARGAVRARCRACGHRGRMDIGHLAMRWGPTTRFSKLARRLRCRRCGARQASFDVTTEYYLGDR
jgi:rubredoxin